MSNSQRLNPSWAVDEKTITYIPSLDGLRAFSVALVLFFHLHWTWFQGGFLGVDLFFLISGYIITLKIVSDLEHGEFTLKEFWLRRIARLMPALLTTLLLTLIFAYFLLAPTDYVRISKVALYNLFYASNFFFFFEAGYFNFRADSQPLLHTWSLSVEEQFYIIWPLILMAAFAASRRSAVIAAVTFATAASAVLAAVAYQLGERDFSFFMMPTRIFQFGLGAIVALILPRITGMLANAVFIMAMAGILVCATWPSFHAKSFWEMAAMPSILGAILLMSLGSRISQSWLGSKLMTFIGVRAYSIYLVHWPIFVFYFWFYNQNYGLAEDVAVLFAAIIAGCVLYELVERRFRFAADMGQATRNLRLAGIAVLLVLTATASLHVIEKNGLQARIPREVLAVHRTIPKEKRKLREAARYGECFYVRHGRYSFETAFKGFDKCAQTHASRQNILILGDSGANAVFVGLKSVEDELGINVGYLGLASCNPVSYKEIGDIRLCSKFHRDRVEYALSSGFDTIMLASSWPTDALPGLPEQIRELAKTKRVVIVGVTPIFDHSIARLFNRYRDYDAINRSAFKHLKDGYSGHVTRNDFVRSAAIEQGGIFVDVLQDLCSPSNCKVFGDAPTRQILYYDHFHRTVPGALLLGRVLGAKLEKSLKDAAVSSAD